MTQTFELLKRILKWLEQYKKVESFVFV